MKVVPQDQSSEYYVVISDDPMRGIRPSWMNSDENHQDVKVAPLPKNSTVWYMSSTGRFDWYIPATVDSYIMNGEDDLRVTAYTLRLDDERYQKMKDSKDLSGWIAEEGSKVEKEMKSIDPSRIIRRWDGVPPTCPMESLEKAVKKGPNGTDIFGFVDLEEVERQDAEHLAQAKLKYGDNFGFEGKTQRELGPEMWGITLQQLRDVIDDPKFIKSETAAYGGERISGGMTMYEVVQNIFKEKTKGKGIGYSLFVNKDKPLRAKVMVSHSWGEDYEHFVSALEDSGEQGPFWVCAAAIYQCEDKKSITIEKQLGPDPSTGPFATVLKQAGKMVSVVTPESDIYTRLWCVYEMYVAVSLGIPVQMVYFSESTGWGGSGQTYFNAAMDTAHIPINTIEAGCSMVSDKEMIQSEVMKLDRGFGLLDDVIYWIKITSLIESQNAARVETTAATPFGVSSASCAGARVNAAIAKILETWNPQEVPRSSSKPPLPKPTIQVGDTIQSKNTDSCCQSCTIC